MLSVEKSRQLLRLAGVFYFDEDSDLLEDEGPEWLQTLNMNDTWGWASAFGEYVPDDQLPIVAELYRSYGWCGILYWVSERNNQMKSEFQDINRFVEFVRYEEKLKVDVPNSSRRAYTKSVYTLGE